MKPIVPPDSLDDLIAAALDNQLTPGERAEFDARLKNDAAARAAYEEAQAMHTLLEGSYASVQPDSAFEQRMVSGVRRRLQQKPHTETAWESVLVLLRGLKRFPFPKKFRLIDVITILFIMAILAGVALGPITSGIAKAKESAAMQMARQQQLAYAGSSGEPDVLQANVQTMRPSSGTVTGLDDLAKTDMPFKKRLTVPSPSAQNQQQRLGGLNTDSEAAVAVTATSTSAVTQAKATGQAWGRDYSNGQVAPETPALTFDYKSAQARKTLIADAAPPPPAPQLAPVKNNAPSNDGTATAAEDPTRKLVRNAELDLEVKSFQTAIDGITALSKEAGGYVDSSNSQRGGNGKLQGTIIIKVLPSNLDDVLLKLRELGEVRNQSVKTDDVTKDYYDTQARLDNSRKTEEQLQELLKRNNGKVADLLEVERELGRVRGQIEQMQGSLKFYDFLVQYATVTIQLKEKDLNQAAAYLLQEQDNFSLFATDVEDTFKKARQAAEDCKAQILNATLTHNSGSDVSAELVVMVPPDQIEPFLAQIRGLGRIADFTRQSQRVAKDGGDSDNPADQTLTEKDKVQVHLSIRSDDESRKQVALVVVSSTVDAALDQAKTAALANAGTEILESSLNKTAEGQTSGQLRVRVPGKGYQSLLDAFRALGRTASFSLQRDDNSGPGANGDEAPVIISLALTDTDTPVQQTALSVVASEVDDQAQQIKKEAAAAGVEVKASNFSRQPDGRETAQLSFRLPMAKYPAFLETLKKLGKVESLTVSRDDRPDQTRADDTAPAEITLVLHNQGDIVADNSGLWTTLRQTFGEGAGALFSSIRTIGVLVAFLAPWVLTLAVLAWIGRRIYLWRKK